MVTATDALNTIEFDEYFVILPHAQYFAWDKDAYRKESHSLPGTFCEYGFSYNSFSNEHFLTVEQLHELLKMLPESDI